MPPNLITHMCEGVIALRSSGFVRNVATVGGGVAVAQAISLAFAPFLTRLYGPEAFGALATYMAVVNIITPVATLGFANAVVLPESEEDALAVARLSILCCAIVAPLTFLFVHFAKPWLAIWTGLEATPAFLYLIPLSLLLSAFLSVTNQAAIRHALFKPKARTYVESTLIMNLGKFVGGLLAPWGLVLIVMSIVGKVLNTFLLLSKVPKNRAVFRLRNWLGTEGVMNAAREQRDFALYRMPQSIIRAASVGLPVIVLTTLFGAGAAGQYSITVLLLSAPVMLLGESVGEVFFPKITRSIQSQPERAGAVLRKATILLVLLSLVPFGTIALLGSWIFPLVFGGEWVRAGEFSQWIALWMAAMLITRPAVAAIPALQMQATLLIYEVVITAARVLALYAGFKIGNDLTSVAAFALVNAAGYAALFLLVLMRVASVKVKAAHA